MEEKLKIIKQYILENINCEAIVLFGSYARESQNEESDIVFNAEIKTLRFFADLIFAI